MSGKGTDAPHIRKSAVALGFFDGVHLGHRAVLGETVACARKKGLVPCAFTFAADSLPVKQGAAVRFLYPDAQKEMLLHDCGIQEIYCPRFSQLRDLDGAAFCREILRNRFHGTDVFCGGDFRFGAKAAWNFQDLQQFGRQMGFAVHQVSPVCWEGEKISSTGIREALEQGNPARAAGLLGAPYTISGKVTHGAAYGRTRGVPTINLPFAKGQLLPKFGVYVSRTWTPMGSYDSITNVGINPTVKADGQAAAETFLLDFSGDLYEQPCRVALLHFLRPEQRFPDVESLYRQIAKDQENCRSWIHRESRKKGIN